MSQIRGVVYDLEAKGTISSDEKKGLLEFLSQCDHMNQEKLREAASLTGQADEVFRALNNTIIRENVEDPLMYISTQPQTEPLAPLDMANRILGDA